MRSFSFAAAYLLLGSSAVAFQAATTKPRKSSALSSASYLSSLGKSAPSVKYSSGYMYNPKKQQQQQQQKASVPAPTPAAEPDSGLLYNAAPSPSRVATYSARPGYNAPYSTAPPGGRRVYVNPMQDEYIVEENNNLHQDEYSYQDAQIVEEEEEVVVEEQAIPQPQEVFYEEPEEVEEEEDDGSIKFSHANLNYFALDKLRPKGPRANADVGTPHDSTRELVSSDNMSSGSWWCAAGGWPSPNERATTEVFFVLQGHGCLTDLDGTKHYFGPGDTVILPKGWSGRWDILEAIHKVWFVQEHEFVEYAGDPIRVTVAHYNLFSPQNLVPQGVRADATHGSSPETAWRTLYHAGPTTVGCWTCTPGSFSTQNPSQQTQCFHVLEGVLFLTNENGTAKRCVAGDTVVIPKGWAGNWDVIEPVKKLWVSAE